MPVISNGATIKSIQRGTITISSGQSSGSATISAVVPANSVIKFHGLQSSGGNSSTQHDAMARLWLTNGTTIGAVRSTIVKVSTLYVGFEVVEFYP